jgi:hypothetical protein
MTDLPCLDAAVMMPGSPEVAGNVASNEILSRPSPSSCSSSLCSSSLCSSGSGSSASSLPLSSRAIALAPAESPYVLGSDPDLWLYREPTQALLRRYHRFSMEVGRLPSLLGREFFRTRVTSYRAGTFEDAVIFVHDVARGLAKLDSFDHKLIARIVLQDYTHNETARLLGCWAAGGARWGDAFRKRGTSSRIFFWKLGYWSGCRQRMLLVKKSVKRAKSRKIP